MKKFILLVLSVLVSTVAYANHTLPSLVRAATVRYHDIEVAIAEGYTVQGPCVSGRSEGAMGIHLVNLDLLNDPAVDASEPEILIYEPMANGRLRLVGVEYVTSAAPPVVLNGHLFHYSGGPNRYGPDPFSELHVWAWKHNPNGVFSDWNPNVSCVYQPTS